MAIVIYWLKKLYRFRHMMPASSI